MEAINDNVKENILLSTDTMKKSGNKSFRYLPLQDKEFNEQYLQSNRHMYEILPPTEKVKLYFDLEMEYEGLEDSHKQYCCEEFIYFVACEIKKVFGITLLMEENDLVIEDSCRTNKLSYHVIVNNKLYFNTVADMKLFILYLQNRFMNPETEEEIATVKLLTYDTPKGETRFIFDPIPYGSFQNFRFIGQSKIGTEFTLKNWTPYWSGIDTFVRLYYGEGDRKLISREMLENLKGYEEQKTKSVKKQQKTTMGNIKSNSGEPTFNTEGQTLFKKYNMEEKDLNKFPTWKRALYLIPNTHQDWNIYRNIAMAVRGAGGSVADFIEWAKISPKYVANDSVEKEFNKFNTAGNGQCYGMTFLRNLAKQCSPEHFKGSTECLSRYFELDTQGVKVLKETSKFVSMEGTSDGNNILDPAKQIILHAYLGRGKTTAIKRLLKNYKSYLFLSPRQTFARFISGEFDGTVCYLDADGDFTHEKFVISVESLYKLKKRDYDVICLDESESIFAQFSSTTMNGRQLAVWDILTELITNAEKVVYADAFLTNRTINIARHFGKDITLIQNETPATIRNAQELHGGVFCSKLLDSIKDGKKNYVCYSSVNKLIDNVSRLEGASMENDDVKKVMDKSLIYHAKVGDEVFDSLASINSSWKDASMVITSPTNTIGCSYSPEGDADFDEVWINAFPTCVVRDTFQTQMRVRHLRENKMVFCLPTAQQLNFCKLRYQNQFDLFDAYESNIQDKETVAKGLICKLIENRKADNATDDCSELVDILESYNTHTKTPAVLKNLYFANLYEETISTLHYVAMFRSFLIKCGYDTLEGIGKGSPDACMAQKINELNEYENIAEIKDDVALELITLQVKSKKATAMDKLRLQKYWFDKLINPDIELEARGYLFDDIYTTAYGKTYIDNLYQLHKYKMENALTKDLEYGGSGFELNPMKAIQLSVVKTLSDKFGLKNHAIGEEVITRESFESAMPYLQENKKMIYTAFKMRYTDKQMDTSSAVKLVKSIFQNYCGLELKSITDKHTKQMSQMITIQKCLKGTIKFDKLFRDLNTDTNISVSINEIKQIHNQQRILDEQERLRKAELRRAEMLRKENQKRLEITLVPTKTHTEVVSDANTIKISDYFTKQ